MNDVDPILALEHDHVHLSRLVAELRTAIGDLDPATAPDIAANLATLRDDLFEHFAREEEALFPYLLQLDPARRPAIRKLEEAHDRICGGVSRLLSLAEKGESTLSHQRGLLVQLFERFDAEYVAHARQESEFLRNTARELGDEQRAHVRVLMRDV